MKKVVLKRLPIIITCLVVIYCFLKFTGILVLSKNPTYANLPNIPTDSYSLSSNLINPKIGDFIIYKFNDPYLGMHKRVHRLLGFQNDTIEIKNGIVFLNGENFDKRLNLMHYYKISKSEIEKNYDKLSDFHLSSTIIKDSLSYKILIEDMMVQKLNLNISRIINKKGEIDNEVIKIYNQPWNKDNFGPIIIPKNKIFVLGDNRDYTFDSRNIGFIDKDDVKGVVMKIF